MTPKEAAEEWSKKEKTTERTVKRWINEGRIPYTVKDGVKDIPVINRPHIINKNTKVNDANVRKHICDATKNLEYIDEKAFMGKLKDYEFVAYMNKLEQEGKIVKMANAPDEADNKSNQWYISNENCQKEEQKAEIIKKMADKPVNVTVNVGVNLDNSLSMV